MENWNQFVHQVVDLWAFHHNIFALVCQMRNAVAVVIQLAVTCRKVACAEELPVAHKRIRVTPRRYKFRYA